MKCTWKTENEWLYVSPSGYAYTRTCCECMLCCAGVCYAVSRPDSDSADKIIHILLKKILQHSY